jgi:dihydrofolate reductase
MKFSVIAAADKNLGIGIKNNLPWRLRGDMKYFSHVTCEAPEGKVNAVIMGRKTWESLPKKHRPLKGRLNVVLTRNFEAFGDVPEIVILASSLDDALAKLEQRTDVNEVFIIGGANVYAQAVEHPACEKIYLTEVEGEFNCDAFFPRFSKEEFGVVSESEVTSENEVRYRFLVYEKALVS